MGAYGGLCDTLWVSGDRKWVNEVERITGGSVVSVYTVESEARIRVFLEP